MEDHRKISVAATEANGRAFESSSECAASRVKSAAATVYGIGALTTVVSLIAVISDAELLRDFGLGWITLAAGALFLGLGFATSKGSRAALGAAIALFGLETVAYLVIPVLYSGSAVTAPPMAIAMRIGFLIVMARGFAAMK